MGYSLDVLREGRAEKIVAFAADELYAQQMAGYDKIGNLYSGVEEADFRLRFGDPFKTVYGEGACALVLETRAAAERRGAQTYGSVLSFASYEEPGEFDGANLGDAGLRIAAERSLSRAGVGAGEIGLVVWSPRGDAQDGKVLRLRRELFPGAGIVTNVFNTGYVESASAISALAEVLYCLKNGMGLWRQKTGLAEIDGFPLPESPKNILCLASSHVGNNFALVCRV